jgi:hypothetical protein
MQVPEMHAEANYTLLNSWPELDAAMTQCDQLKDWENPVGVPELAEFFGGGTAGVAEKSGSGDWRSGRRRGQGWISR